MTFLEALWLGVLQGLTEFLPISSSGHLALLQSFLGLEEGQVFFDVMVHVGTLGAVVIVFRRSLAEIVLAVGRAVTRREAPAESGLASPEIRLLLYLAIASIPTVLVGLFLKDAITDLFSRPRFVSMMLIVTGLILQMPRWLRARPTDDEVRFWRTPWIGLAQALAIVPGISRSGSTISAGLALGVKPEVAARFSFLLSIPAILGAALLELADVDISAVEIGPVIVGTLAAFTVGWISLRWLLAILQRGRLGWFTYYCVALGVAGLVLS